jgi:Flp pilus assembly pilin Flp
MNSLLKLHIAIQTLKAEKGQTMGEYSIVMGVIALAAIVGAQALGGGLNDAFNEIVSQLPGYVPTP